MTSKYYREKKYYPALEAVGVRKLNPHCCRHTFATLMDKAGASRKATQELMGHADYKTTASYTHVDIEELRKNINLI